MISLCLIGNETELNAMHPTLHLYLYQQQLAERLRSTNFRRLAAQMIRERERPQLLEHAIGSQILRLGLWLRVKLVLQFI
jgi:hypothetical protein